jgi:hypothetical protein
MKRPIEIYMLEVVRGEGRLWKNGKDEASNENVTNCQQ